MRTAARAAGASPKMAADCATWLQTPAAALDPSLRPRLRGVLRGQLFRASQLALVQSAIVSAWSHPPAVGKAPRGLRPVGHLGLVVRAENANT